MTILSSAFWYWNGKINRQLKFPSPVSDLWNLRQNINFILQMFTQALRTMAKESANRQGAIHFFCVKFPPLKQFPHWNEYLNTWRKKQHKYVKQFGGNELSTKEEANVNEGVLSNGGIQVVFKIWHHCWVWVCAWESPMVAADPDLQIRGEGRGGGVSSRPWDNGGPGFNFFFGPLTAVLSKNKGRAGPPAPPLDPLLTFTYPTRNLWYTGP